MEAEAEAVDFLKLEVEAEAEAAPNSPLPDTLLTRPSLILWFVEAFSKELLGFIFIALSDSDLFSIPFPRGHGGIATLLPRISSPFTDTRQSHEQGKHVNSYHQSSSSFRKSSKTLNGWSMDPADWISSKGSWAIAGCSLPPPPSASTRASLNASPRCNPSPMTTAVSSGQSH